jgi:tight adherence protein C
MGNILIIVVDTMIFVLMVAGVMAAVREVETRMGVRRRLSGKSANPSGAANSLFRQQNVRNPFLAWVQGASLKDPKERQGLRQELNQAGFESPSAPAIFVVIRFALATLLPISFVFAQKLSSKPINNGQLIMFAMGLTILGLIGPKMYIDGRVKARRTALENEFPDALDLLVVCTEAGLGFESAFIRVAGDTQESHPLISKDLVIVTQELRAGRTRADALRGMADRNQSDAIKSFVALLIQTDALGGSVAQSLRTYASEMRQQRMLKAEEKAMRIPILLSIPLVLFILPVIMVAVMLPAVISVMRGFSGVVNK